MKILVVDDNAMNRKYLRVLFMQEGHTVLEGEDGLEALHKLEREKIDAVISDILMPRMDGYRLCYEMRKNPALNPIPFVAYTATYTSSLDKQVALDFGADRFVSKPASPEVIIKALHEAVKTRGGRTKQFRKPDELLAMKEYSETLVRKLEETNHQLFEANEALSERAVLAEFNAAISNALNHRGTLRVILQLCAEAMVHYLEAAFARIWTYNPDDRILELRASAGMYTHLNGGHARVPLGQFKIGLIASERKPHVTNSVIGDPRVHDQEWAKHEGMVAFAGYPLIVEEQLVGVMAMFARKPLSANSIKAMESVAKSVATGVERKWAEEERQKNLDRIRALHEIHVAIASIPDLYARLHVLLEKIELFVPVTAVSMVRLVNSETGELESLACRGMNECDWRSQETKALASWAKRIAETKAAVAVLDIQTLGSSNSDIYRRLGLSSCLGVPLITEGRVLGVLGLYTEQKHEFTEEEIEFLETLASEAAIAIHNAQLHEQTKRQHLALIEQERIQRILKELSQDITKMDVDALLEKLTSMIRELFKVDISDIRFLASSKWANIIVASDKLVQRLPEGGDSPRGATDWVVKNHKPIAIENYPERKEFTPGGVTNMFGIRGFLAAPLMSKSGEVIGVIRGLSKQPRTFTAQEINLFEQLANGAAIAVENEHLYVDLEKSNKIKSEFLSVMSHELRTPVNVIIGYSALGAAPNVSEDERQRWFHRIESQAKNLLDMVNSIMAATQIESGDVAVTRRPVDVGELFEQLKSTYDFAGQKNVALIWQPADCLPTLLTDYEKLAVILRNLISNALKFTERGNVTVSAKFAGSRERRAPDTRSFDFVEFDVSDTGLGIPEESLPVIFDLFRQADSSTTRAHEGVGLGLYIAKKYAELLCGTIAVESTEGRGTVFTVQIPVDVGPSMPRSLG